MNDEVEMMAEAISRSNPVTIDGEALDWEQIKLLQPGRASMYREAATNRIRAADAMRRLDQMPAKTLRS